MEGLVCHRRLPSAERSGIWARRYSCRVQVRPRDPRGRPGVWCRRRYRGMSKTRSEMMRRMMFDVPPMIV